MAAQTELQRQRQELILQVAAGLGDGGALARTMPNRPVRELFAFLDRAGLVSLMRERPDEESGGTRKCLNYFPCRASVPLTPVRRPAASLPHRATIVPKHRRLMGIVLVTVATQATACRPVPDGAARLTRDVVVSDTAYSDTPGRWPSWSTTSTALVTRTRMMPRRI